MEQRKKAGLNKVSWWGNIGVRIAIKRIFSTPTSRNLSIFFTAAIMAI